MQFAANLDYLWTDAPVSQAIVGAAQAGFDAVELGVLAAQDIDAVIAAQEATGMEILSLSVSRGNIARDDCGLAAVPGREGAASLAIDQAIAQAVTLGVPLVEVTAGRAQGPAAYDTLLGNLDYACSQAALHGLKVAMGPQNSRDVVGGFLSSLGLCRQVMADLNHDALRLVFDCYDVARSDGDLSGHLTDCLDNIGVLRFAGVPARVVGVAGCSQPSRTMDQILADVNPN